MSKEIKKGNIPAPKPEPKQPTTPREMPNLNESNRGGPNNLEKGESRRPTMETPIPPPPKKND